MLTYPSRIFFAFFVVGLLSLNAAAQAPQTDYRELIAANKTIPDSPLLHRGRLSNGLSYFIQQNKMPEKKLELRLVVKAGSILEDEDQRGLAHFVEHMAFNGSRHFKKNELVSYLESIGVKFGADLNAYTSFDETVYILPVPTDNSEHVAKAFMVLADWAYGLSFDAEEIDKERGVVLEELRLTKGAGERLRRQILPKILQGSRYADRLPIGQESILKQFSAARLKQFYQDWYRPDLMAVVVVGDIDPARAKSLIEKNFAAWEKPQHPRARLEATVPLKNTGETVIALDKEASVASVSISQARYLRKNDGKFGSYRQRRIQAFFNVMLNQRLRELAQLAEPPFLAASSGMGTLVADYQELNSTVAIGKAGVEAAMKALLKENQRVAQFGFTEAELERAKSNDLRMLEHSYQERGKSQSAELAAEFIRHFLSHESLPGIEAEYRFHKEIVQSITLEEMNRFAKQSLNEEAPIFIIYQGNDAPDYPIPTKDQLRRWVHEGKNSEVSAYAEKKLATRLMEQLPAPAAILSESQQSHLGTTTLSLANGVEVVLKPTDFKSDQILFRASRGGGLGSVADADFLQAKFATSVVGSMGIKDMSPNDLSKYLAGKRSSVSTNFGDVTEGVSGLTNQEDLETALQLLFLAMTEPRRDESLFSSFINKQKDALKQQMSMPMAQFQEQFIETTFPPHPRRPTMMTPGQIEQLNLDKMMQIYRSRFHSAYGMKFFFIGNFDIEKIKPLLQTYLGALPTPAINIEKIDHGLRPNKGIVKKSIYVGQEQQSMVSLQMHGERVMTAEERLQFHAMTELLQLRLTAKMREELGAVYSPRISASTRKIPYQAYTIVMALPCAPERVDDLLKSGFELIDAIKTQPVSEQELAKVKENWLKNHRERIKTNEYWLSIMSDDFYQKNGFDEVLNYEALVKNITVEQIQAAAKEYLDTQNYIQILMFPKAMETSIEAQSKAQSKAQPNAQ